MSLFVAIQMDPIESINIQTDSTYLLGLEAEKRGHHLFYYTPENLIFSDNQLKAYGHPLYWREDKSDYYTLGNPQTVSLNEYDVVLMRQDPPFDMAYITATYLLEHLKETTLVVNNPREVRNSPEKLLVTHFPDLTPPTLITRNREEITAFRSKYDDIIVKPLYLHGGKNIFHIKPHDDMFWPIVDLLSEQKREPLIFQKYFPSISTKGDKRAILIDGKLVGAFSRIPPNGDFRANTVLGGSIKKTQLTTRETEVCNKIGKFLSDHELLFAGLDLIEEHVIEINVTSPTGIAALNQLNNVSVESIFWDTIESSISPP
ncbi:MAG: glutathione synthase [Alphaproteobacteria bacterium]|jgi:glutathione synthase|nr:glutathione synthase [Alphaproteobacteria bacterium]MBT5390288.1 glutathione synthase [Alphaproteobacteria bacterium]MBT5540439.1 glutathione synthase [Alphaproteobacteria bacterium]MBT5654241.1 glutathione synthase [Alphaproteobacteria bacterium]